MYICVCTCTRVKVVGVFLLVQAMKVWSNVRLYLCAQDFLSRSTVIFWRSVANADHSDLMDSLLQFDTFRHTPSINIILTLHVCVYARVCVRECSRIQMSECIQVCLGTPYACVFYVWERLWVIDSGVIYYSTVTSISKVSSLCASLRSRSLSLFISFSPSLSLPFSVSRDSHKRLHNF